MSSLSLLCISSGCSHLFFSVLTGMYQKSCLECESCPAGSYTTQLNREEKCHFCSGDCRPGKETMSHTNSVVSSITDDDDTSVTFRVSILNRKKYKSLCISRNDFSFLWLQSLKSPVFFPTVSEFNLKVIQECTNTSNVKCVCEDGYECNHEVPYSTDCRFCVKIKTRTTTGKYWAVQTFNSVRLDSASRGPHDKENIPLKSSLTVSENDP